MTDFDDTTPVETLEFTDDKILILDGTQRQEYFSDTPEFNQESKLKKLFRLLTFQK